MGRQVIKVGQKAKRELSDDAQATGSITLPHHAECLLNPVSQNSHFQYRDLHCLQTRALCLMQWLAVESCMVHVVMSATAAANDRYQAQQDRDSCHQADRGTCSGWWP
jgi:hypothetical protein